MHKGVLERKKEPDVSPPEIKKTESETKLFPVLLTKNYAVGCEYEIVGYLKEAVKRKDAAGNWRIVEPEEFIKGEMKPHTSPGVGFPNKIWAGTTIKLPVTEAKRLIGLKAAERADDIAA